MLKKIIVIVLVVGLVGILLIGAVNRTLARTEDNLNSQGRGRQAAIEDVDQSSGQGGYGQAKSNNANSIEYILTGQGDLDEADKEALIFMREEEKLAHDVYVVMYELWGLPIFQNISTSEQSHMDAVKTLLDGYDVTDPASEELGVFSNPNLQTLYNNLVAQGSQSLSEALRVGAAIEEIDIIDLQERLSQTENADIQNVFTNLLKGSSNHLRAFTSTLLSQTGETYQPQFMSLEDYQAIIGGSAGSGGQGRGSRGSRGGRP